MLNCVNVYHHISGNLGWGEGGGMIDIFYIQYFLGRLSRPDVAIGNSVTTI